jgi:hypothetical protein
MQLSNYVTDQPSKSCMGCNRVNHKKTSSKGVLDRDSIVVQNLLVEGNQPHLTPELFVYLTFLWRIDVHCHGDDTQIKRCRVQLFPRHYGILSCPPVPESYISCNDTINVCNKIRYYDEECLLRRSSEGEFWAVSLWKHKRWRQKLPLAWMSLSCNESCKQEELQTKWRRGKIQDHNAADRK